jgi:hypothetical protein
LENHIKARDGSWNSNREHVLPDDYKNQNSPFKTHEPSTEQCLSQFGHTASSYADAANHPTQKYSKLINQKLSG